MAAAAASSEEGEVEDGGGSGNPFSSPAPRLRPHVKRLVEQVRTLGSISLAAVHRLLFEPSLNEL